MQKIIHILLISMFFLPVTAKGKTQAGTLFLGNADDKSAVVKIANFLVLNGLEVTLDPKALNKGGMLVLKYNKQPLFVAPRLNKNKDRIDRLVFYEVFHVKKGMADSPKLVSWIMNMNSKFNFATFAITKGMVVVTSQMTFLDRLDINELKAFLKDLQMSLARAMMVSSASKFLR